MTQPESGADALAREVYRLCVDLVAGRQADPVLVDDVGVHPALVAAPGPAVVLQTSGSSSGEPRRVLVPVPALRASAEATAERIGSPGQWVSCLPAQFVGGFMVLFRAALAGVEPLFLPPGRRLADALTAGLDAPPTPGLPLFISVVPAQLRALLAHNGARDALAKCAAVLVGGDALPAALRQEAVDAGVPVISTYGMTETCGGCVYDGVPLPGVRVSTDEAGRVLLAGPQLVAGYLDGPATPGEAFRLAGAQPFVVRDGVRWLATSDHGSWDGRRLSLSGRLDDVIITGGRNVAPANIEERLRGIIGTELAGWDWAVSGVPHETWGTLLVLALARLPGTGGQPPTDVLTRLTGLPNHDRPRMVIELAELPRTASGKLSRRLLAAACAAQAE